MKCKIKKHLLWKVIDDEVVIVDPHGDEYSYLNSTGSDVWRMIDSGCGIEEIVQTLSDTYDEAKDKIRNDVLRLVDDLVSEGLIEAS